MRTLSPERLLGNWRRADRLCFVAIMLLAAVLRFSHLDIAHFQLDQSRAAALALEMAGGIRFHTHFFELTGGYYQLPLSLYIWTPAFWFSSHIHALVILVILLNLLAVALCWGFVSRYWRWRAAAIATLLFATLPWHAWNAPRIWSNTLASPFVMLWLFGAALAFHERRRRMWCVSWGAALLLLQLHPSGAICLLATGLLWLLADRDSRSWRWAALGVLLAFIPALPWLAAHLQGDIVVHTDRLPLLGEGKRVLSYRLAPLIDFMTASDWRLWFRSRDMSALEAIFRPLELAAAPAIFAYAIAAAFIIWRAISHPRRSLYRVIALWLVLPLLIFPFVSFEDHAMVYYLPMLPSPFIAIAVAWETLNGKWRTLALAGILSLAGIGAVAIASSSATIRSAVDQGDSKIWAAGGGAPLNMQLDIATAARSVVDAGQANEIILLVQPVLTLEYEHLVHAMPLLSGQPIRILDPSLPHVLYPAHPSVWLLDRQNTAGLPEYAMAERRLSHGRFELHVLPGSAAPEPANPLPDTPGYANGVRLLGYDALDCGGAWRLHWTPGETSDDDMSRTHFFVHLLGADDELLAQHDLAAFDARHWRSGDRIVTTIDFDQDLSEASIETARVGMYLFSLASNAYQEAVYALDEAGNPWQYAIDIPFAGGCESADD